MPAFENMMVTITLLLFFLNGIFIFATDLPGDQTGVNKIQLGISPKDINDMNNRINNLLIQTDILTGPKDINSNVSASSAPKGYLALFQPWLFSVLDTATFGIAGAAANTFSLFGTILTLFGATFFGYLFWLDLLIPPLSSGLIALNAILKVFLFIVQMLGIFDYVFKGFSAGAGVRG